MASSSYAINFNGLLAELGEQQIYTFDGTVGDRIYFDAIDSDPVFQNITYSLIDPSGATIYTNFDHTADSAPGTLTATGTYQIVIRGAASTTGDYNFNLFKLNQAPVLTLGTTISDSLTPGLESAVYRFTGTRGQRLQFDSLLAPGTATNWSLWGPNNQQVNPFTFVGTDFSVTLPGDGEYVLIIDGTGDVASLNYSFQVNDISDPPPASPTAFPFVRSGNVAAGTPVDFTFTAAAGTLLYFDSLDQDFDAVNVNILDPGGATLSTNNAASNFSQILPRSGAYTVRLSGTGDFNFRLLDVAANATALTLGSVVTENVSPTQGTRIFSFTGTVGQQLFYDGQDQDFDAVQTFLIGPSGNRLSSPNVNASSDSDIITLSESGTYYLVQESTGQAATDFSFQLLEVPGTDLALDALTNSTLSAFETELYRFNGTAGQRLAFDSQSPTAFGANVFLRGPNGEAITSWNLSSDAAFTLTRTGNFFLVIGSTSATSFPYSFQLVTPNTTTTDLSLGSVVNGTISEVGEQDIYTFTGATGQRLLYDATVNNGNALTATLLSPSGAVVGSTINSNFDGSLVTLTEAGVYQLVVQGQVGGGNSTGNYNFKLIDASAAPTIDLDAVTTGTLAPGAASDFYRFTAAAGQRLVFDAISSVFTANYLVFDQGNTQIFATNIGFDSEFTAPEAGTYLLQIQGGSTAPVNYSFQLVSPTTTSTALTLNSPVAGTISELGEQDIYTFTGTAGQRLIYDATANNANNLLVSLLSPSGGLVVSNNDTDFDNGLITLTETGTYQLIVRGNIGVANSTGNYNFKLIDASAATTINLDAETTGTLSPGAASDFYRFTAAAGQRLVFDSITGSGANFRVFDLGNTQIAAANIGADSEFTVPEAGTYLLEIQGFNATPVNYSFQLVSPTTTVTALTLTSPVAGTISELGEQDIYTFAGTAGQRLIYDTTVNNGNNLLVSLVSPSGVVVVSNHDTDFDDGLITLTETGTYQLIVRGNVGSANSTGNYNFKLIDASAAPLITLNSAITGTLTPGAESDFFRLSGTAGQRLNFDSLAAATGASWLLYDPSNSFVSGSGVGVGTDFVAFLEETGTYLLEIRGSSATNVNYNFNVTDVSDPLPAAPTTFPFSQSGTVSASTVDFTITAAAGQLLYVDSLDPDFDSVSLFILDTGNANAAIYANSASFDSSGLVLPRSGNYTVRVTGTGDYNFQILDLTASSTLLTLGSSTSGPLASAASRAYRFTGSAGQRLYYDALEADGDNINVVLLRPDGTIVQLNQNSEADRDLFTLADAGTYHLVLRNNSATAADFNFALRDAAAATPLSFDTVTNGTLSPGQETDLYRFTGTAGQRLGFDSLTAGFPAANWKLYGPTNQIFTNQNIGSDVVINLTVDGTYVLAITGSSAPNLDYSFSLVTPTTTTTALSFNTPIANTISELGERDIYTFTGSAGQQLFYDALTNDFSKSFPARLIDPSGDIVFSQAHSGDRIFTLTEDGTYQLLLESTSDFSLDTGSYNFQLLDLAAATPLSFDTVTNGTSSGGREADLYRFTGTAGQRLVFDSQTAAGPSGLWVVYGPTLQTSAVVSISGDQELNLTADGSYILAIQGSNATSFNYSFSLVTPTTTTTALSLNTPVSGTIAEMGERDIYTFTGTVGQRLFYDALTNDFSKNFRVRLTDPSGDIVSLNQQHYSDSNTPFTLTEAGTYQLVLESTSAFSLDTGSYSFQLLDLAAATELSFDTVTTGTLAPGQETDLYRFTGTAGQRLVFDSQTPGFPSANWGLFGPTNQFLTNQNITTDLELNLTADGTYILAIDGASATTINYSFSLITPTTALTGSPSIIVNDRTGATNTPIALNIAASFASSDANDLRTILISGVPTGATLSAGTNNNNGTWSLTPAQLTGLTITVATAANFALTVTATSAETTGDTATTTATFSVIVNVATGITVTPTSGLVTSESGGSATFSVVLDSQPTGNVTVGISSSDTTEGTPNVSSLTFTPANWNVAQTVVVTGVDDSVIDDTVAYSIITAPATSSDPNYNGLNAADVSLTNTDNDTAGVTVSPTGGLFTTEAGGTAGFNVRLTSQPTANVSISLSSSDTTEGTVSTSSLTFTPANWNVFQFVTVTGVDDAVVDGSVAYTIVTGATSSADSNFNGLAVADVSVTNLDNDAASFSINDVSIQEGNAGTSTAIFTVTLSNAVAGGASVNYATANGTATAGSDYVATNGTLAFSGTAGETQTVAVTINGDTVFEPNETFVLNLSTPTNGVTLADSQGLGTITNDDAAPLPVITLTVSPASVTENGAANLVYTFTRTGATTNPLTVNYAINGTATNGSDYGLIDSSVVFAAGSATATVTVDPTGDAVLEPDETVSLTLTANAAYTIGTAGPVTGTISNDDAASFSISDVAIVEGDSGTSLAVFTVTLSNAVAGGASVSYATADNTATAGSDYVATNGTLVFTGNAGEQRTVSVTINGDTEVEPNESFFLNLSAPTNGVTLADGQGRGTISNDDVPPQPVGTPVLFFSAVTAANGRELWLTDGTEAGTRQVIDATPGPAGAFPSTVQLANGKLLFASDDAAGDTELWVTDGTTAGTSQLVEINPIVSFSSAIAPTFITPFDGGALFFADDGLSGNELWFTDGTAAGTRLLADIQPGATGSRAPINPARQLTVSGSKVFFTANTTAEGNELWVIESVAAGPRLVTEIVAGSGSGGISVLTAFKGGVFFYANDGVNGVEAWFSDGSAAGTVSLGNLSLLATAGTTNPTVVDDRIFFAVEVSNTPGVLGGELYVSDGTAASTTRVLADVQWPINTLGAVDGKAVFIANDGVSGSELWISDGTPSGTQLLKDIQPGGVNSNGALGAGAGILFNGELYFRGTTTAEGAELWKTDGTEAGTVLVVDINPGTGGSNVDLLFSTILNGRLYFRASTPGEGFELWSTDGTAAGTTRVADINPGTAGSTPTNFSVQVLPPPVVSIGLAPATAEEGEAFTLTATRNGAVLSQPTTVTYTITGPAANAGDIATPLTGTITILANQTTATLSIATVEDTVLEADETFTVTITNPVNGTLGTSTATATIIDDDAPVAGTVSISDLSITEGDAGTKLATFTLTRSGGTAAFTVNYATADGTATAGSDYVATSGTLSFAAGVNSATVSVTINGDTTVEPDEAFVLNLSAPTNGVALADGQGLGTILNDDAAPVAITTTPAFAVRSTNANTSFIDPNPFGLTEVDDASPTFVDIDGDGDLDAFIGNSAGNTLFFLNTAAAGSVSPIFAAPLTDPFGLVDVGSASQPRFVDIDGDGDLDALIGNLNGQIQFFRNTATPGSAIPAFSLESINPFGLPDVGFDASPTFVDIDGDADLDAFIGDRGGLIAFSRNTAPAGSSTPSFAPAIDLFGGDLGSDTSPELVDIDGDGDLDAFVGTRLGDILYFQNTAPAGSATPIFAAPIIDPFGYTQVARDGSAVIRLVDIDGDGDLDAFTGFSNGEIAFFRNTAPVLGLNSTNANGTYTVGDIITLTVTFSEVVDVTGSPLLQLETGTTDRFATFTGGSGTDTLTFSYTVELGDSSPDLDALSASALTLNGGTIQDVDGNHAILTLAAPGSPASLAAKKNLVIDTSNAVLLPTISLSLTPSSVLENGASNLVYTFTRTGATTNPLTVNYAINGTATNGSDYGLIGSSVTFAAGSATATVTVDPTGDAVLEPDESVSLTLSADPAYLIGTPDAITGTISNDDAASFSISDVSIVEGDSGTSLAVFTVTLSNAVAGGASVSYATADNTASAGSDYIATAGTLNFTGTAGEQRTVSVTINGDMEVEPNESFFLNLSAPTNGVTLADGQGIGTITNDDAGNSDPVFVADPAITIRPGQTATITGATLVANDTDADGDTLTVAQFSTATSQGGSVANTAFDTFIYTPPADFTGTDTFSYVISDGAGGTADATLAINVVNGAPVVVADPAITIRPGQTATILGSSLLANDTDPDGDTLTVAQFSTATSQGGSVANTAFDTFVYTPAAGFTGTDTFSYVVSDGFGGTTNATLALNVVNGAPVFVADPAITIQPGQTATILGSSLLANDTDPDGDSLTVAQFSIATSQGGSVANTAFDTFVYTPAAGFTGTDTFSYVISDGFGGTTNGSLAINVQAKPSVSVAVSPASVLENGASNLVYTFTRTGPTTNPLVVNYSIGGSATNGTDYGLIGTSITFATGSATATLSVDPIGDSVVEPDETVVLTLLANDAYTVGTPGAVTGTITNDDLGRTITGTKNRDSLVGTAGDDVITGLQGADSIRGNGGADRFVYRSIVDAGDTIIDFNRAEGDKVDLKGALASVGYTGTSPITDGYLKFVARGSDTMLQLDPDGSGLAAARNFILFKNVSLATLSNPDNFLV